MLVFDSTDAVVKKHTEQLVSSTAVARPKPRERVLDWFDRDDFLACSRRQKDAEFPVEYDV